MTAVKAFPGRYLLTNPWTMKKTKKTLKEWSSASWNLGIQEVARREREGDRGTSNTTLTLEVEVPNS